MFARLVETFPPSSFVVELASAFYNFGGVTTVWAKVRHLSPRFGLGRGASESAFGNPLQSLLGVS